MEKKRLGTGRVAFLARIDVLQEKIKAGHTIAMLHDEYKKELGISYGQFLNYVNRYIRKKPENETKQSTSSGEKPDAGKEIKQPKKPFVHDPNRGNTEDFI